MKEKLKLDEAKTKLKGEGEDKPKRTNQMVRLIRDAGIGFDALKQFAGTINFPRRGNTKLPPRVFTERIADADGKHL